MYDEGKGITQDYKAALKWFKLAAEQGHADAQNNLGLMYANGQGVTQNLTRAFMWWDIAAKQGHENARFGRAELQERAMTPSEITLAQELAQQCIANNYQDC